MSQQTFDTIDVARLQIEDDWPGKPNIVPNPTGEFGTWGWSDKSQGAAFVAIAGPAFRSTRGTFAVSARTVPMQVVPSDGTTRYVRGLLRRTGGTTGIGFTLSFTFFTAALGVISTSTATSAQTTNGTKDTGNVTVPSNAKFVTFNIANTGTASGHFVEFTDAAVVNGTSAEVAATPTVEPAWVDLLSPATNIEIVREELNLGTLSAVVRDSSIDPATSDVIRKGKIVRALALDAGTGLWELLFRGEAHVAEVTYDLLYPDTTKRARITVQAVDPTQVLAATPLEESVATLVELRDTLLGATVPWIVNGSSAAWGGTPVVTARSANASALDQVAITRDTVRGYAWMSRKGVLTAWDRASIPGTVAATIDEDDYTDLGLGYASDDLLNDVSIIVRGINTAGETVETRYGPYADDISAREHGRSHADFTVTGAGWTETTAAAYAAAILATNPVPRVRVNSLRMPVKTTAHITPARALLDLYDKVTVNNTASGIAQDLRITRIVHSIEPKKWTIDLGFAEVGGVAVPQIVPPVQPIPPQYLPGVWYDFALNCPNVPMSSVQLARFMRIGDTVKVRGKFTLGGAVSGPALIDPPFPFRVGTVFQEAHVMGHGRCLRSGVAWHEAHILPTQYAGVNRFGWYQTEGPGSTFTSNAPAVWASGDEWGFDLEYEAAPL